MSGSQTHEVTELLRAWSNGDENALEELTPIIYSELYKIAKAYMRRERENHILQTTALVNEAYMRLIDWESAKWNSRKHFYRASAQLMRRILVDFARKRPKTGSAEIRQISLRDINGIAPKQDIDILVLHEALTKLEKYDERKVRIVELRFFGGLSVEETAEALKIAPITVMREWQKAKSWLFRELSPK